MTDPAVPDDLNQTNENEVKVLSKSIRKIRLLLFYSYLSKAMKMNKRHSIPMKNQPIIFLMVSTISRRTSHHRRPNFDRSLPRICSLRSLKIELHFSHSIPSRSSSRPLVVCENPEDYPEAYRSNSEKEELILTFVENFRRQYHYIYRDRKPLLLNPLNECGVPVRTQGIPSLLFNIFFQLEIRVHHRSTNHAGLFRIISMECRC